MFITKDTTEKVRPRKGRILSTCQCFKNLQSCWDWNKTELLKNKNLKDSYVITNNTTVKVRPRKGRILLTCQCFKNLQSCWDWNKTELLKNKNPKDSYVYN
jgi:hypothetical protein